MYSWEITSTMEQYNYNVPSTIYLEMTQHSPQINKVTFMPGESRFEMSDTEGNYWNFTVHYEAA